MHTHRHTHTHYAHTHIMHTHTHTHTHMHAHTDRHMMYTQNLVRNQLSLEIKICLFSH